MLLTHTNTTNTHTSSSTPTPGSSSSTSNTLEPPSSQHQQQQHYQHQSSTNNSRPPSRAPSILDSPTLARVERARLRLEAASSQQQQQQQHHQHCGGSSSGSNATTMNREDSLERNLLDPTKQSLLAGRIPVGSMTGPIKRGLLWQQRDRLFSRWKERYFVLTRDYLHCFKRASGSANERASDMGQFIFKVKLVDVEKVEWLNRRSYSAIGLLLGREGRVLLRCDDGLEDWFELLEECTLTSKERRRALKIAQGPRSRASLAAPVSHAALQNNHFGLGGTYSSALEDWLMTNGSGMGVRQKIVTNGLNNYNGANPFLFSDSVPDLSVLNNENHNHISGMSTNHSTPQKIPYSSATNNGNHSRYSNGYASQNNSFTNTTGLYGSPRRIFINSSFGSNNVVDEETEDGEVQLRRPRIFGGAGGGRNNNSENGNELDREWLYRKPRAPTDMRHSVQPMLPTHNTNNSNANLKADLDYSAHDSGLDTPPSTHRPSSYREHVHQSPRDSTETTVSSSRGTLLNSPVGSMRAKHLNHVSNLNQVNALNGSRYSIQQERVLKIRNEETMGNRFSCNQNQNQQNNHNQNNDGHNDANQNNRCYYGNAKNGNQTTSSPSYTPQHTPSKLNPNHLHHQHHQINQHINHNVNHYAQGQSHLNLTNNNGTLNGNNLTNGSAVFRERYQHPALAAIINEAQGMKFRDRSYSDCQQFPTRRFNNNNPSPMTPRRNNGAIFGTPTRV